MKSTTLIGLLLTLALAVDIYVRLRTPAELPSPEPGLQTTSSISDLQESVLLPAESAAEDQPGEEPASTITPETIKLMGSRLADPVPTNEIGMVTRLSNLDFQRYLVFMNAGLWAEQKNPDMPLFQGMYNLTDEELQAVTSYAATAIRIDREFQAGERRKLCARRAELQSTGTLGEALNNYDKAVHANRESLARSAAQSIGSVAYSKIDSQLLSRPMSEVRYADFPILLAARDRDLASELAHLCDRPWR